jgi:hypothetical protein
MGNMEVTNVVASIIGAFSHGMDLFRRMTGKKPKRRGREPTYSEEEMWLRDSLDRRPREIRESFDRSVARHGHRFQIGDSIAHTSLAHTLLVLNSGLIKLINQALSSDSKKKDLSRRSLLNLSEVAAADTLNALSQLSLRLNSQSQLNLPAPVKEHRPSHERHRTKRKTETPASKKRPAPSPLLVRGGWVRPKSGSSSTVSVNKAKPSGGKHMRSKSESAVPKVSRSPPNEPVPVMAEQPRRQSTPATARPPREPSMLLVPSELFQPLTEEPQSYETPPPRPPKIPLHARDHSSHRPRPRSSRTNKTLSTKIGEMSDGRRSQQFSSQMQDPRLVQYLTTLPDFPIEEESKPEKKGRGFKFWKKAEKSPAIAAF